MTHQSPPKTKSIWLQWIDKFVPATFSQEKYGEERRKSRLVIGACWIIGVCFTLAISERIIRFGATDFSNIVIYIGPKKPT